MALGMLMILFIILIVTAIVIQVLLYLDKNGSSHNIFVINMLLALFLSYLAFTSLPTNFTGLRILAVVWGALSVLAMFVRLKKGQFIFISKIMLSIAIVGNLVQLFL